MEAIGEAVLTANIVEDDTDIESYFSSSDEEDDEVPLSAEEFTASCIERSCGTNYFTFGYYHEDDDELMSSSDGSVELNFDSDEEPQYQPDNNKYSESDEEYLASVWNRVKDFIEGDSIAAFQARFQEEHLTTFSLATNLEILNYLLMKNFGIIDDIIPLIDLLLYLQRNPVQFLDPAFSAFSKTMQIIMRNSASLGDSGRIQILHLLNRDKTIIHQLELGPTSRFIENLLSFIPKFETDPNADQFEEILRIIHEIYLEYMDQPDVIEGITSLETINVLHKVLKHPDPVLSVKYCVMEILSIICANFSIGAAHLIRKRIHLTLIDLDQEYKFKIEAVRMHLVTLIWSILPNLPERNLFKLNDDVRELTFKTENVIKMAVWHTEVERGNWVPFIPRLNYLIEQSYKEKKTKFTCYDYQVIKTVHFDQMVIIDESTSRKLAISREEIDIHRPLIFKKQRRLRRLGFQDPDFFNFAYKFLTRRFSLSLYNQEKYYCMETLLTILELMGYDQQVELLFCSEPKVYVWRADQLVQVLVTLLKQHPMYCQMFAVQILSVLAGNCCYEQIFGVYGIGILLQKFRDEKERTINVGHGHSSLELDFQKWTTEQVEEYIRRYNLGSESYPSYVGVNISNSCGGETESRQELEYYKASFFDEKNSDITTRRSEAIKYFIWYLTGPSESDHRICRMRHFLDVFLGIPALPQCHESKIDSQVFKDLVTKIGYFLVDNGDNRLKNFSKIVRNSINTFGKIDTEVFRIIIRSIPLQEYFELQVRPFMTVRYLQHYIYSKKYSDTFDGFSKKPNKRFVTKSKLSINGIVLSPQMTIYEVIMKYGFSGSSSNAFDRHYIFLYQEHEALFPAIEENNEKFMKPTYVLENYLKPRYTECEGLTEEVENALHLSNILYGINKHWTSAYQQIQHQNVLIDPEDFENLPLSNSVLHRLLDPFAALMGNCPHWIKYMVDNHPFVFPLKLRTFAFRVLYLDRLRAMMSVVTKFNKYHRSVFIYEKNILKLTVERSNIVNDVKEYMLHTSPTSSWEVVFKNEIGAGQGLQKELFNSIGKELQKEQLNIWTSTGETQNGFVQFNEGLYPKLDFCSHSDFYGESSSNAADIFITIGAVLAKGLMENTLLTLPLATPIFKCLLNQQCLLRFDDLKYANPAVHKVLEDIRKLITERDNILNNNELTHAEKLSLVKDLTINGNSLECYDLNFVLPGHEEIELIPDGANASVDIMNAHVYVDAIMKKFVVGIQKQMSALKWGFDHMISLSNLNMFEPEELQDIILGTEDDTLDWSYENLAEHVQLQYCSLEDIEIQHLFTILSSAKKETRKNFLEFVTACSRLPIGGLASLDPPLTVCICRETTSAQTCFRLFRLKRGMELSELKKFIEEIIPEALDYFGLV